MQTGVFSLRGRGYHTVFEVEKIAALPYLILLLWIKGRQQFPLNLYERVQSFPSQKHDRQWIIVEATCKPQVLWLHRVLGENRRYLIRTTAPQWKAGKPGTRPLYHSMNENSVLHIDILHSDGLMNHHLIFIFIIIITCLGIVRVVMIHCFVSFALCIFKLRGFYAQIRDHHRFPTLRRSLKPLVERSSICLWVFWRCQRVTKIKRRCWYMLTLKKLRWSEIHKQ